MKEIGSEFWDAPVCKKKNHLFPETTKWFLSGRSALRAIIREITAKKEIHTAALPSWCCESIIIPFIEMGIKVVFYPVVIGNGILQDIQKGMGCDILFVMDYFGYINAPETRNYSGIIIRDVTHSLFSKDYDDGGYCFGSLRKWCGVWTGGFLYGGNTDIPSRADHIYANLRKNAMQEKARYISGKRKEKEYLDFFQEAEKYLDECTDICLAEERDISIGTHFDIEHMKQRRRGNAETLLKNFPQGIEPVFPEIGVNDCPLFVPILTDKRDRLRCFLTAHQVYCPVHWPVSKYHRLNCETQKLYDKELSIVCDQRYGVSDMEYICSLIREGMEQC